MLILEMCDYQKKLAEQHFAVYDATSPGARLHRHTYLELGYVKSGTMEHTVDGIFYILRPGDYYIIDHAMSHMYKRITPDPLLVRNLIFSPSFLDKSLTGAYSFRDLMASYLLRFCYQTLRSDPTGIPFHDEDGQIGAVVDTIAQEYEAERYGHLEYIRSQLVAVLILTMRKIGRDGLGTSRSAAVNQMMDYADNHYRETLRLNELAKQLGYSASYLSQKFSVEMGMTFMEYIHEVRIRRTCLLLETTDLKVAQIAEAVGYESTQYLNKIFKKALSITPREFRAIYK